MSSDPSNNALTRLSAPQRCRFYGLRPLESFASFSAAFTALHTDKPREKCQSRSFKIRNHLLHKTNDNQYKPPDFANIPYYYPHIVKKLGIAVYLQTNDYFD